MAMAARLQRLAVLLPAATHVGSQGGGTPCCAGSFVGKGTGAIYPPSKSALSGPHPSPRLTAPLCHTRAPLSPGAGAPMGLRHVQ